MSRQTTGEKADVLRRLASIEGHVRGIQRMVQQDQSCCSVLEQLYAVERALQKCEAALIREHLHACLPWQLKDGDGAEVLREISTLFALTRR